MTTEREVFIGIKEAAAIIGVSVPTVYRRVAKGKYPVIRGEKQGKILFDRETLILTLRYEALNSVKDKPLKSYLKRHIDTPSKSTEDNKVKP